MLLAVFAASTWAASFDDKIKAPAASTNAELKAAARDYFDAYAKANTKTAGGIVRDAAAHRKWLDTWWKLGVAVDTWTLPVTLAEYGVSPKGDGTYEIDIVRFPQWDPLDKRLTELLNPQLFDLHVGQLRPLGLRDADVAAMKAYLAAHRPDRRAMEENLSLVESFGAAVTASDLKKKAVTKSQLQSFKYQVQRNSADANREWAVGLLDCLDQQRQRILTTYFMERGGHMALAPSRQQTLDQELAGFRSGEYLHGLEAQREKMIKEQMQEVQP